MHLAALAGVRPSLQDPVRYMDVNVRGTQVLLDQITSPDVRVVFGSSSSVYGGNKEVPFAESQNVDHPVSPYAASKKAGEVLCYTWHHLHGNPLTCLRFFTVYGRASKGDGDPQVRAHDHRRRRHPVLRRRQLDSATTPTSRTSSPASSAAIDGPPATASTTSAAPRRRR